MGGRAIFSNLLVEESGKPALCNHIFLSFLQKYLPRPSAKIAKSEHDTEFKLSQYADDTTLTLDGSEDSCVKSLTVIGYFGNISGLRLNYKNTEALWTGFMDAQIKMEKEKWVFGSLRS